MEKTNFTQKCPNKTSFDKIDKVQSSDMERCPTVQNSTGFLHGTNASEFGCNLNLSKEV